MKTAFAFAALAIIAAALAAPPAAATDAKARDALCFTTDDGEYPCEFEPVFGDGSFVISAPDKPTFTVSISAPGEAYIIMVMQPGGRGINLPGPYHRSEDDPACWGNPDTGAQLCVY